MPARMTRSAPQSPFELPEVRAVVRATRLSCQNARKAQKFTPVRGSSGESRFISTGKFVNGENFPQSAVVILSPDPGSRSARLICRDWRQVRASISSFPSDDGDP